VLDEAPGFEQLSPERQVALADKLIAERIPVRIEPGELIVGSASYALASYHQVPALYQGKPLIASVSHLTLGFDHALRVGYKGLRAQIEERLARGDLDRRGQDLLESMLVVLEGAGIFHARYLAALDDLIAGSEGSDRAHWQAVRDALAPVPEHPPTNFRQAAQALWFLFAYQRACGNWPGLGRVDEMLGGFLKADLASGAITLDEARELLASMWIRGAEWTGSHDFGGSGDKQYYQNVVLGGINAEGNPVTNEVTWLLLDVVEELRIADFPIAVRIREDSPEELLRKIATVQRLGGGTVAVYNEPFIIQSMVNFGYSLEEARRFANDGCWELQVPGRTYFAYRPFDMLAILQNFLGVTRKGAPADYPDFESFYAGFRTELHKAIEGLHLEADGFGRNPSPAPLISLLERDCIEKGRGYFDGGATYRTYCPHAGGLPDTANSLLTLRKLVYEEQRMSLPELVEILRAGWEGHEELRQEARGWRLAYGNDDPVADAMAKRIFTDFVDFVLEVPEREGVLRYPGVSTFGREIEWRPQRGATADGHQAGDLLATNLSPTPGTDHEGPTAVIKSHCSLDLSRLTSGAALELKVDPASLKGEDGLEALVALMRTFCRLGGIFMHIDAVNLETLLDAQQHPENHTNLSVRISGWSARFITLNEHWQQMIIGRSQQSA
jgi:formate C-acetyltransferase